MLQGLFGASPIVIIEIFSEITQMWKLGAVVFGVLKYTHFIFQNLTVSSTFPPETM